LDGGVVTRQRGDGGGGLCGKSERVTLRLTPTEGEVRLSRCQNRNLRFRGGVSRAKSGYTLRVIGGQKGTMIEEHGGGKRAKKGEPKSPLFGVPGQCPKRRKQRSRVEQENKKIQGENLQLVPGI